ERVVVVEMSAETFLVTIARDAHHERVAILSAREEPQRRRFTAQLIGGVVHVGEVLDLRQRQETREARAEAEAQNRLLVEQRVEHAAAAGLLEQAARDSVHAALARHVLAEDQQLGIFQQQVAERAVERERERERAFILGQLAVEEAATRRF